jgi:ferrous iron transport protein B
MNASVPPTAVPDSNRSSVAAPCIALVGNPNVGKTSLFNRLTNLLAKTSNFAGTTVEVRTATISLQDRPVTLVDLPGLYSLDAASPEERIAGQFLRGELPERGTPSAMVVIVDAGQMERTLFVVRQALEIGLPILIVVNMTDTAAKQGIRIDYKKLSLRLGVPVVPVSARTGDGFDALQDSLAELIAPSKLPSLSIADESCDTCGACPYADGYRWSSTLAREVTQTGPQAADKFTVLADKIFTHALCGPFVFVAIMLAVFMSVFSLAQYPMELLDGGVGAISNAVAGWLPAGDLSNFITQGLIGGVGSVLVFLPQICVLFFMLTLLEDCGYLSRAVLVVDGWMRKVGLPGQAFVPLLAAHACAIPAIMSTRVIENRRDRLAAIMVIPLMTCSARLPVYAMVAAMLFPHSPLSAALLFAAAYLLGMVVACGVAWALRLTILPGNAAPLILDIPPYRTPSLGNAVRTAWDRGIAFIRDAGTVILVISIGIWVLSTYPKLDEEVFQDRLVQANAAQAEVSGGQPLDENQTELLRAQLGQEYSLLGRSGKWVQPLFEPLGYDWKTSVGVIASFAAREVVVSTLSILYGAGEEDTDSLIERISTAKRSDGSPAFGTATCVSLLVFFVLAMQCLPTQAVTRKETGSWKWAAFQLIYMTVLAYGFAFAAKQACDLFMS